MAARGTERVESSISSQVGYFLRGSLSVNLTMCINRCVRVAEEGTAPSMEGRMRIRVSVPAYKLVYEQGSEEVLVHRWEKEAETMIQRARTREEERRKSQWLLY